MVFSYAMKHDSLRGIAKIDCDLPRTIKGMPENLEVKARTHREWEQTILNSYDVWREIHQRNGGSVALDLEDRTLLLKGM